LADVFISYERGSQPVAQRLASRMTALGFSVWWDEQIPAHRAYAEVIEERLRAARSVIVLWSEAAVQSQWVRAEANLARGGGKLIQAVLDDARPPLPFDQIQHADLRGWTGQANHPGWRKIEASVRELVAADPAPGTPAPSASAGPRRRPARLAAIGGVAVAVLACTALGAWFLLNPPAAPQSGPPRIAVMTLTISDPAQAALAADIQDAETAHLTAVGLAPVTGATAAGPRSAVRIDGRLETAGGQVHAIVHLLNGQDGAVLWTGTADRAAGDTGGLAEQLGRKVTDIAGCAATVFAPRAKLTDTERSLFLRHCDLRRTGQLREAADAVRAVARSAPDFAPAQAEVAIADALAIPAAPEEQRPAFRAEATAAADRALKSDAKLPAAYLAKAILVQPNNAYLEREKWLKEGVSLAPDGTVAAFYADLLLDVGRWRDAVQFSTRGRELDPNSPGKTAMMIDRLFLTGSAQDAKGRLVEAQKTWPDILDWLAVRLIAFSDPVQALRIMEQPGQKNAQANEQGVAAWRAYVEARQSHSPAAAERAAPLLETAVYQGQLGDDLALRALLTLGRTDLIERYFQRQLQGKEDFDSAALFSPEAAAFRRTPAFMTLANTIGLGRYWKASGKWPDFCAEPGLPYKCQDLAR
jgi:tetratricopeptide (TPR) repeat protein